MCSQYPSSKLQEENGGDQVDDFEDGVVLQNTVSIRKIGNKDCGPAAEALSTVEHCWLQPGSR